MSTQHLSLYVSIIVTLACIILFIFKKSTRPYYALLSLAWGLGVWYYLTLLLSNHEGTTFFMDLSPVLRTVQYVVFGTYPVLDAIDVLIKKYKENRTRNIKSNNEKGHKHYG